MLYLLLSFNVICRLNQTIVLQCRGDWFIEHIVDMFAKHLAISLRVWRFLDALGVSNSKRFGRCFVIVTVTVVVRGMSATERVSAVESICYARLYCFTWCWCKMLFLRDMLIDFIKILHYCKKMAYRIHCMLI